MRFGTCAGSRAPGAKFLMSRSSRRNACSRAVWASPLIHYLHGAPKTDIPDTLEGETGAVGALNITTTDALTMGPGSHQGSLWFHTMTVPHGRTRPESDRLRANFGQRRVISRRARRTHCPKPAQTWPTSSLTSVRCASSCSNPGQCWKWRGGGRLKSIEGPFKIRRKSQAKKSKCHWHPTQWRNRTAKRMCAVHLLRVKASPVAQ